MPSQIQTVVVGRRFQMLYGESKKALCVKHTDTLIYSGEKYDSSHINSRQGTWAELSDRKCPQKFIFIPQTHS